jgi:5-formyltetrahydrofolate cyclo-ligase
MPSPTAFVAPDPDAPRGSALHEAKVAARRDVTAARDAMPADARAAAAAAITARIVALPMYAAARTVLLTLPFRSEWDTLPLIGIALAEGKKVAAPRVNRATRMLELHALVDPPRDLVPGAFGIPEPVPGAERVAPEGVDLVLVPGVAFDRAGRRLGYGGGYYDRLLPLLGRASRVAGAFDVQLVERVPSAPHDLRVDVIVTESQTLFADPVRTARE